MGYSIIVLIASVALFVWFVFVTDASPVTKVVVATFFAASFICLLWIRGWSIVGLFSLVAVSVFIVLYRACHQARFPDK